MGAFWSVGERLEEFGSLWERSGVFGRVWERLRAFKRSVLASLGESGRVREN